MCLGIPGRVLEPVDGFEGQIALVEVEGAPRRVNIGMLDAPPESGEWVLIHMGFALEVVSALDAERARSGLELLGTGSAGRVRRRIDVAGVVQGVGFRPFVYAAAAELMLSGSVRNDSAGVVVEVEGDDRAVDELVSRITHRPPPLAMVEQVGVTDLEVVGGTGFRIADTSIDGGARTLASPDVATCADCLAELRDPQDRRYRHPFISCTNCGPRFTIITGLPYDRPSTTMAPFEMCGDLPSGVRRSAGPSVPRPDRRLPRLRADAAVARPRVDRRDR